MVLVTDRGLVIGESDKIWRFVFVLSVRLNRRVLLRLLLVWNTRSIINNRRIPGRKTRGITRWWRDVVRHQAIGMYAARRLNIFGRGRVIRRTRDRPLDFTVVSLIVIDTLNETKPSQGNCQKFDGEGTHPRL
jgi:hypothetical protein